MKRILFIAAAAALLAGCVKEEAIEVQKFQTLENERSEKADYYAALREYKQSEDHVLSYVYMGRYATLEGASNLNVSYTTLEHRFVTLPDSLDVVNLWMGAPTDMEHSDYCFYSNGEPDYQYDYSPECYADMQYCREVKGTRFVLHADASHYGQQFQLIDDRLDEDGQAVLDDSGNVIRDTTEWTVQRNVKASHEAYAEFLYRKVVAYHIDGLDFDYEGWGASQMNNVINYLSTKMGPNAETEEGKKLLLIIDYFGSMPPAASIEKCSYIVRQAYSVQSGLSTNSSLENSYPDKMILVEQWEQGSPLNYTQGGKRWSSPSTNEYGEDLYSLEAYALFCKQGGAKGFGAYYIDNDYNYSVSSARGYFPRYGYLRNAIRAANPIDDEEEE